VTHVTVYVHVHGDTEFDAAWLETPEGAASVRVGPASIILHDMEEADQLHAAVLKAKRLISQHQGGFQGLTVFPVLKQDKDAE
jgi:hypothetical protein